MQTKRILLTAVVLLFSAWTAQAALRQTAGSGNWTAPGTWVGGVAPGPADFVIVNPGHTVTMNGVGASCDGLHVDGNIQWTKNRTTIVGASGLTITVGANITGTSYGTLACTGNVFLANPTVGNPYVTLVLGLSPSIVISGGGGTIGKLNVDVGTVATNSGTLNITSDLTGTGTFQNTGTCNYQGSNLITVTTFDVDGVGNTFVYNAPGSQPVRGEDYYNLTLSGGSRIFPAGLLSISGTLSVSSVVNTSTNAGTVQFKGSGAQTIPAIGYYNLALANAGVKTFAAGSHSIKGTITMLGIATADATTNSTTINYNNTGAQTVKAMTYYNLTLSGAGTKTFASGTTTISNNMTVSGTATGDGATNSTIVTYNKAGAQTVGAMNYYDLQLNTSGVKTFGSGTTGIANTLSFGGTASANFTTNSTTVDYNGGGAQSVLAQTYHNLSLSNAGVKTFAATVTYIKGDFTIGGSASADLTSTSTTIEFNGGGAQNVAGAAYNNLTISKNGTKTLTGTATLKGLLTVSQGTFDMNSNSFTLLSDISSTALIAQSTGSSYISGAITVEKYASTTASDDHLFGSPVSGALISDFSDDLTVCSYEYDEATGDSILLNDGGWTGIATSTAMTSGKGYGFLCNAFLKGSSMSGFVVDVTGTPHMGTQTLPVSAVGKGYNLVSNPYPCNIDWEAASGWARPHINPTAYVYNPSIGDYRTWNYLTSSGTGERNIAPFQAFFVQATYSGAFLQANESVKAAGTTTTLYKAAENKSSNAVSIKLGSANFSNASVAMVQFFDGATNDYDAMFDAQKLSSPNKRTPYLATITQGNNERYAVNALPTLMRNTVVPVIAEVKENGTYFISLEFNNLASDVKVILEDTKTGIKTDLTRSESYSFSTTTTENNAPVRFYLHFVVDPASSVIANDLSDRLNIYTSNNLLNIDFNVSEANNANVEVFNLMGQKVSEMNHLTVDKGQKAILDLSAQPVGVYLVNVNLNGEIISRKVTLVK